ncbi:pirin family protein [Nitrospira sp. KM1]|uniref:pirin family protein n=1 Tax=Nitrospira sp. KM1 TaxID=1936990 RepID=UPI001567728F|nr:pirin family protein [Nitrospira sp. KM1]
MSKSFVLRAADRGHDRIPSTGPNSSYVSGHPESFIIRDSSFNFHEYQDGRHGFGRMRVFGDEVFHGMGCGYNMHPHHNFIICAVVLKGCLIHINTLGDIDQLGPGDYYAFSAGSGGKHTELSIGDEDMHAIYLWFIPGKLSLPPTYARAHFDSITRRNQITQLVGDANGALPVEQDIRISRLAGDRPADYIYTPRSSGHGVYVFVIDGELQCQGETLGWRDSIGAWGQSSLACRTGHGGADVLLVETIM